MDPEGVRGPPCSINLEMPRGWVARVNKDITLVVIQLEIRRIPPITPRSRMASFLPVALGGGSPGRDPYAITNL
jgi:hypothetical protein